MRQNLFPAGTPMIPCGGLTQSNSKTPALSVSPAQDLEVQWEMGFWTGAALHEGWVTISLAHDDAGPYKELAVVDFRGKKTVDESPHGVKVTLPSDFKVGDTATLQFNWTASVTPEIFYNCADLKFTDASYTPPKTDSKKPVVAAAIAPPIVAYTPPSPLPPSHPLPQTR
ncbi:hypothetical protein BC829DRAFT_136977 [Chytridium lagenaria]|nr:hypothetical protein BC829DRAFT_136977 [Chytridium lagenaria]